MGIRLSVRLKVAPIGRFWELQPKGWCVCFLIMYATCEALGWGWVGGGGAEEVQSQEMM